MITEDLARFHKDLDLVRSSAGAIIPLQFSAATIEAAGALSSALVVLLSGQFESFLKATMRSFIEEVNNSYVDFEKLPLNLRLVHFKQGARVLQDLVAPVRKSGDFSELYDLSRRLASVVDAPFEASWEAFVNTHSNPGPETVKELVKNLGLEDFWGVLREKPKPPGLTDLELFLRSFIEMRNECAHTGATSAPLSPSDIVSYADSLQALAEQLVTILLEHGATCVAA